MEWGFKLKEIIERLGLSNADVAKRSGLSEAWVSRACKGDFKDIKQRNLERLAKALSMLPSELNNELLGRKINQRVETPEQILERFRVSMPATVPIYSEFPFHAGTPVEPADYIAIVKNRARGKMLEAYVVRGQCLEPEVKEGDIIIVDRDGQIDNGDIVACLVENMLHLARMRKIADVPYLENNNGRMKLDDVKLAYPVIEVRRRIKL